MIDGWVLEFEDLVLVLHQVNRVRELLFDWQVVARRGV